MALGAVAARAAHVPYTITANYLYFDIDRKVIECTGDVTVTYQNLRIHADNMRIDVKWDLIEAEGNARIVALVDSDGGEAMPVDTPDEDQDQGVVETENLKQELDRTMTGDRIIVRGDLLLYDLEYIQGMVLQTASHVGKYYFQGLTLTQCTAIRNLRRGDFLDEQEGEPLTSLTAKKIKISAGSKYEAWHATLYVKGGKTLTLPYYTNDAGKVTPGNWRLQRLHYSSNENFTMGVGVRYSEKPGRKGTVSINYKDKANQHFTMDLSQQVRFGGGFSGTFGLSDIGSGDGSSLSLNLNRYSAGMRYHTVNLRYSMSGYESLYYNMSARWGNSSVRGYVQGSWYDESGTGNLNSNFTITPPTRYYGSKRKVSSSFSYSLGHTDYTSSSPRTNAFVGVSLNHAGWNLGPRTTLSTNLSTGYGANTEGQPRNNFSYQLAYRRNSGRSGSWSLSYRFNQNRSYSETNKNQYLTAGINFNRGQKWNSRFSTSYDLLSSRFSSVQGTLNVDLGEKCRLSSTAVYDLEEHRFQDNIFHLNYDFYGSLVNIHWYKETNDFIMDFRSKLR